jgi:hypothetical protein
VPTTRSSERSRAAQLELGACGLTLLLLHFPCSA